MRLEIRLIGALVMAASCELHAGDQSVADNIETVGLGLKIENAVEVCDESGERQYLARLICPNGHNPKFKRIRNFGWRTPVPKKMSDTETLNFFASALNRGPLKPGEPDYHVVSGYRVRCADDKVIIYMDMHHCAQPPPTLASPGFSIAK